MRDYVEWDSRGARSLVPCQEHKCLAEMVSTFPIRTIVLSGSALQHGPRHTQHIAADDLSNLVIGVSLANQSDGPVGPVRPVQRPRSPAREKRAIRSDAHVVDANQVHHVVVVVQDAFDVLLRVIAQGIGHGGDADEATLSLMNTISYFNTTSQIDGSSSSTITIDYSDIQNGVTYGSWATGTGNIDADPSFISTSDYHLNTGSPCIDTGNPDDQYKDKDGTRNDMGAYGGLKGDW